jgi:tetratricopeptide (TPR) repeat protein
LDAYHLYLKGRYFWNQRGDGIRKGMEYFQQAAAADSRYALPYVGLADTYALLGYYGSMPPKLAFPLADENATRALSLNPSLAEAHTSKALVKMYFGWDWQGADEEFLKAIALDSKYPQAHYWLSVLHTIQQDPIKAVEQDRIALEVDPVSPFVIMHHGWTLHCAGRYKEAIKQFRKALELDHKLWSAYNLLVHSYSQIGSYNDALAAGEILIKGTGNSAMVLPSIGYAHAKAGEADKARAVIAELESRDGEFFWPSQVACIYGELEEFDLAFEWLEKAYLIRDHWLITMNVQPGYRALHADPRYSEFASRVGIGN